MIAGPIMQAVFCHGARMTIAGRPKINWTVLRKMVFERDGYKCIRCDADGDKMKLQVYPLSVHHLLPRADGGGDAMNNLVTLCIPCHDYVELNELRTVQSIVGSYTDKTIFLEEKIIDRVETFIRPEWHAWVYGSSRNPLLDIR